MSALGRVWTAPWQELSDVCSIGRVRSRVRPVDAADVAAGPVEVSIPILPVLARTLAAGPCGDLAFICGAKGQPFAKESFGNAFSEAARAAGVNKSAHGVRKIAATRAADNGATEHQLMAIFGWKTPAMPMLYTREANRRRLARESAHLLANETATSIPSPNHEVRAEERKIK